MCAWQMFLKRHAEDAVPTYYCSNKACEREERAASVANDWGFIFERA